MRKSIWLCSAAAIAISGFSAPAVAQTGDDETAGRDVIMVTARKKEESIQEVPVAVTAFGSEDLFEQGIQNIEDLSRRTPGFIFDSPFGRQFDRPIIRGQANILGASGVSVFIDGVNVPQSIRSINFGDIDRIEIIKGPQSALFGRNTYSGAINITSRQPTNEFNGELSAEVGADGLLQFLGNIRGPIIEDKLFFSLSGRIYDFDSEFDVDTNENPSVGNESSRSISGVVRFFPTENWEITARAAYNEDDDGHFPIGLLGFEDLNVNVPGGTQLGGTQPFFDGVVPTMFPMPSGSSQLSNTLGEGGGLEREEQFYAINSNFEFADGYNFFTTIGYTKENFRDELDSDGQLTSFGTARIFGPFPAGPVIGIGLIPFDFTTTDNDETETFVAEARIDSPADKAFRWRLGGYYFKSVDRNRDLLERFEDPRFEQAAIDSANQLLAELTAEFGTPVVNLAGPITLDPVDKTNTEVENISVFGSLYYDLTDRLTVTGELRWAEETINQTVRALGTETLIDIEVPDPNDPMSTIMVPFDVETTFTAWTPRFIVDYQATDNNLLYASAARGTKPGGFNGAQGFEFGFGTFEEETNWQFELGSKNVFADNQLVLNLAGFFSTLSDYQLTENLAALGANTTTGSVTANVGDVDIFGIELETSFTPNALPGLTLGGTYAWTDTEFTAGTEATQGAVFGDSSLVGQELPRQARHQASFFGDYEIRNSDRVTTTFSANGTYLSSRFAQVQNLAETGSSFEIDARITMELDEKYSLSFYGKNLTNEDAAIGVLRFIDPSPGNGSLVGVGFPTITIPTTTGFNLASAGQSRGFQYNNRNGARWGIVARMKF